MQFPWGLLPGAREARNDLAVGYAWLVALALFVTIPTATDDSNLGQLIAAAGPVATAVAVSFAAALLGSMLTEVAREVFHVRGARAFLEGAGDVAKVVKPDAREEVVRLTTEFERTEATSDRLAAEFLLLLIPPLAAAAVKALVDGDLGWAGLAAAAIAALAVQAKRRHHDYNQEQRPGPGLATSVMVPPQLTVMALAEYAAGAVTGPLPPVLLH